MKKVIIWGAGQLYNKYKNNLDFEVLKNNLEVLAIVSKDKFSNFIDGKKLISKEDIVEYEYDYIVVFVNNFEEIKLEALNLGINRNKIINGSVFGIPCFDFTRYSSLIENPVTIISNDCWGGIIYNYLKLEVCSPFKNCYIKEHDYIKLCNNLEYYLSQPLKMEREGSFSESHMPLGSLGDGNDKVIINFIHNSRFEDAYNDWERRIKKVNLNRIFIKWVLPNLIRIDTPNIEEFASQFLKLPYENKILFYNKFSDDESIIVLKKLKYYYEKTFDYYRVNELSNHIMQIKNIEEEIDLLKLLCGEKDYLRYID